MSNHISGVFKRFICICLIFTVCAAVNGFAEETVLLPAVRRIAEKAFSQKTAAEVRGVFETSLARLSDKERCQLLVLLAEYEHQKSNYRESADRYGQAAALCKEGGTSLLLKAIRTLLFGGYGDSAYNLLKEIKERTPLTEDNPLYITAAVYEVWCLLAENHTDTALAHIKSYLQKKAFTEYHPALLFTVWWIEDDHTAKQRLIQDFPTAAETAAVLGKVTVLPSVFWYLMPRSTQSAPSKPLKSDTPLKGGPPRPVYYQLGFYKTRKYADNLAAALREKNFHPVIKEEKRPSGTVYFAVLVEENTTGTMGLLLKDAGYESFPIFP